MFSHQIVFLWGNFIRVLFLALLLIVPLLGLTGYSVIIDFNTRISPNDACIGTYYFWWTNLTYLPLFFFLLTLLFNYFSYWMVISSIPLLASFLLGLYPTELLDYLALNSSILVSLYNNYGLNTLLTNTLNRYHPWVFYVSIILLSIVLLGKLMYHQRRPFFVHSILFMPHLVISWTAVCINFIALWMGSWWALQEGTWGGWWNWDSSEVFGLLVALLALWILHSNSSLSSNSQLRIKSLVSTLFIIVSYFFIQLNFDLVSHNFGSKFFFFFNNNLFFLEVLIFSFTAVFFIYYRHSLLSNRTRVFNIQRWISYTPLSLLLRQSSAFIIIFWVMWSYRPLLNYFLWNFSEVNVLNFELSLQPVNLAGLLLFTIWLIRISPTILVTSWVMPWAFSNFMYLLVLPTNFSTRFLSIHLGLLGFSLLNIILYDSSLIGWINIQGNSYSLVNTHLFLENTLLTVLDSTSIEQVRLWASYTDVQSIGWNLFSIANSPSINFFTLGISHSFFENYYYLSFIYTNACLWLELPLIGTLNFIFIFLVMILLATIIARKQNFSL